MAELTEETVKSLTSAIDNMNKSLEKTNAAYLTAEKHVNNIHDTTEETQRDIEKGAKKTSKLLDGLYNTLDRMSNTTQNIVDVVTGGGLIASFAEMASHAWKMNDSLTRVAVQMGKGREGGKALEINAANIMKHYGTAADHATEFVKTLAEKKYLGNIEEAAAGIDLFSRATGVAQMTVLQLTDDLEKQAGLSTKSTNAILAGMVNVQQKVGISRNGMEALSQTIMNMSTNMAAFGKSSDEIKLAAQKTTVLVGAMEKVGISAQKTTELIERMTDPDRIEDNILLYSQLGISMEDALSGDVDISGEAMKEMAQRITDMGAIAGGAMAKQMGLSYKEMTKMAKAETEGLEDATAVGDEDGLKVLDEAEKKTEGLQSKAKRFMNEIQGFLLGLGPIILTGLTVIIPKIIKLFKGAIAKITGTESGAMQASVETNLQKAAEHASGKFKNPFSAKFAESGAKMEQESRQNGIDSANKHIESLKDIQTSLNGQQTELDYQKKLWEKKLGADYEKEMPKWISKRQKELDEDMRNVENAMKAWKENIDNVYDDKTQKEINDLNAKLVIAKKKQEGASKAVTRQEEAIAKTQSNQQKLEDAILTATGEDQEKLQERLKVEIETEKKQKEILKIIEEEAKKHNDSVKATEDEIQATKDSAKLKRSTFANISSGVLSRMSTKAGDWQSEYKEKAAKGGIGGKIASLGAKSKGGAVAMKAGGALAKGIAGIAKSIGPMAIVMAIISKILDKFKEPLQNLLDNVVKALMPVVKAIMPVFLQLLNIIVKTLLPPILKVLAGLLKILGVLLTPLKWILKALSGLPVIGKALGGVADMLDTLTGPSVTGALTEAADNLANSNEDLTKSTDQNTEATKEETPVIEVKGGQAIMTSNGSSETVNSTAASTTQNTSEQKSDEEKNKEANEAAENKKQSKTSENINNTVNQLLSSLIQAVKKLDEIANNTSGTQFNGKTMKLNPE